MHPPVDTDLAALARRQHGMITYRQLRSLGLSHQMVKGWLRRGRIVRVHHGVFALGYVPKARESAWSAAVLECGEGALLSHFSAAALHGIRRTEPWLPHVSVPTSAGRAQPRIHVHRVRLAPTDRDERRGIPVTSVARTLADLSALLDPDDLHAMVREAMHLRVFDLDAVGEVLERRRARALRLLVEDLTFTGSRLEQEFLALCERSRLPLPRPQFRIAGFAADFAWPGRRVVVEIDGVQSHLTLAAFHSDRAKGNVLTALGWRVLRFTHADVRRRPARTMRTLRKVLGD